MWALNRSEGLIFLTFAKGFDGQSMQKDQHLNLRSLECIVCKKQPPVIASQDSDRNGPVWQRLSAFQVLIMRSFLFFLLKLSACFKYIIRDTVGKCGRYCHEIIQLCESVIFNFDTV